MIIGGRREERTARRKEGMKDKVLQKVCYLRVRRHVLAVRQAVVNGLILARTVKLGISAKNYPLSEYLANLIQII